MAIKNLYLFVNASAGWGTSDPHGGFFYNYTSYVGNQAINCIADVNGNDSPGLSGHTFIGCSIINSGSTSAGTASLGAITQCDYGLITGCSVNGVRTSGIALNGSINTVTGNIITNCQQHGIYSPDSGGLPYVSDKIINNTIHNNAQSGIYLHQDYKIMRSVIMNNNITQNGAYGIDCAVGSTTLNDSMIVGKFNNNNFGTGGTANASGPYHNLSGGSNDLTVDPQYTNAAAGDFSVGTNVKAKGYPTIQ